MSTHPSILAKDRCLEVFSGNGYPNFDPATNSMKGFARVKFCDDRTLDNDNPMDWHPFTITIDLNVANDENYALTGYAIDNENETRVLNCALGCGMTVTNNSPFISYFACKRDVVKLFFDSKEECDDWMVGQNAIRLVAAQRHYILHPV